MNPLTKASRLLQTEHLLNNISWHHGITFNELCDAVNCSQTVLNSLLTPLIEAKLVADDGTGKYYTSESRTDPTTEYKNLMAEPQSLTDFLDQIKCKNQAKKRKRNSSPGQTLDTRC